MTQSKHTPDLQWQDFGSGYVLVDANDRRKVVLMASPHGIATWDPELKRNRAIKPDDQIALKIAAVDELISALRPFAGFGGCSVECDCYNCIADRVLRKAEGR